MTGNLRHFCAHVAAASCLVLPVRADLVVASLNPVVTDLARQVGGAYVEVVELMKPGMDPHAYRPTPADLRAAEKADVILVAGKGLETYLEDVRGNLLPDQEIFEVGRMIPSLRVETDNPMFVCCPAHAVGTIDPHWWHSVKNVDRAVRILAREFGRLDPEREQAYRRQTRAYREKLDALTSWVRKEIARIPRGDRILVTSHLAYAYFCEEFGFRSLPVQGLSTEDGPKPAYLGEVVTRLRENHVKAVFPEVAANPRVIEAMVKETGVRTGGHLLAGTPDPREPTYIAMVRHNVTTIVNALAPR